LIQEYDNITASVQDTAAVMSGACPTKQERLHSAIDNSSTHPHVIPALCSRICVQ